MRLPHIPLDDPRIGEVDIGLVGVPWDGGTTNRPGPRHGTGRVRRLFGQYRAVLCDLDGCLVAGAAVLPGAWLSDDAQLDALEGWVRQHYREQLEPADLADPQLIGEVHTALDALTQLLGLGGDFYAFQRP